METPAWGTCSLYLFLAILSAGIVQAFWMPSKLGRRTAIPLDGGGTFRGKRIFGDNKTWRGFIVMVPASGIFFVLWHSAFLLIQGAETLWPLSNFKYFLTGTAVGAAFMLAELPNSFFKRQAGVQPGKPASGRTGRILCFLVDQVDSVLGSLIVISFMLPLSVWVWVTLTIGGAAAHLLFNFILLKLGIRSRAA